MTVLHPDPVYFPLAVASILRQTMADFELIIVEDPSPISGRALLGTIDDPRVRYVENPRRTGLVEQKNEGLAVARGAWVAMMDADDVAEPDRLVKQLAFVRAHPEVDVLGSQITLIDARGAPLGYRGFPTGHDDIVRAMRRIVPVSHPSVMLRRALVQRFGGYQYRTYDGGEDYELWSRLARRGARFANHPEALIRYRLHPDQMKVTCLRQTIRAILDVKRRYWADRMDWGDRLRMAGEFCLLGLPVGVVLRLLHWVHYRGCIPARIIATDGGVNGTSVTAAGQWPAAVAAPSVESSPALCGPGSRRFDHA